MWITELFETKISLNPKQIIYITRYAGKVITVPEGVPSDGATNAPDLCEKAYRIHDWICDHGKFDDGTPITNFQASTIYKDVLMEEGKKNPYRLWGVKYPRFLVRSHVRWPFTFAFGGKKLKKW